MADIREQNRAALAGIKVQRDALYEAVLDLELALTSPAGGRVPQWVATTAERVAALQAAFDDHVRATEGPGGLFAGISQEVPRLAHAIDELERDHGPLSADLDAAAERLASTDADGVAEVRDALFDVIHRLLRHRAKGAELVFDAYNVDLAGGE